MQESHKVKHGAGHRDLKALSNELFNLLYFCLWFFLVSVDGAEFGWDLKMSRLDHLYRSLLLTKFFTKGWGKPENLKRFDYYFQYCSSYYLQQWRRLCDCLQIPRNLSSFTIYQANIGSASNGMSIYVSQIWGHWGLCMVYGAWWTTQKLPIVWMV